MTTHRSLHELEAALDHIRQAPRDAGSVTMIVRRPQTDQREVLEFCELDSGEGLVGDNWKRRGYRKSPDGAAHPDMQINLMNARAIAAIAPERSTWPLAGDQFYVDLDLGKANLPPGTRLRIGTAELEVTAEPHLGCRKFQERFGKDAVTFVNSDTGKQLNLRGINARVVKPGIVRSGDPILNLGRLREPKRQEQGAAPSAVAITTPEQ